MGRVPRPIRLTMSTSDHRHGVAAAPRLPLRRAVTRSLLGPTAVALAVLAMAAHAPQGRSPAVAMPHSMLIAYTVGGGGPSRTLAQSVPGAAAPTVVVSGSSAAVSWNATTLSGGTPSA